VHLALDISEHFFNLTTESLRLRSNETRCYQTSEIWFPIGSGCRVRWRTMHLKQSGSICRRSLQQATFESI
jgi:hypothetical protein